MTRKEHAELHFKLIDLLTDCKNDNDFHERLEYAKQIIDDELNRWNWEDDE